jgi:prepilin-type N-terminal cleavage/methylation domain-containing protein
MKTKKGFTLLELLIALTLMSAISITATQMLRTTTTKTKKLTSGMSDLNRLRSAVGVMRNDFLKAFNYRDLNIFLYNQAQKERVAGYNNRVKNWIAKKNKDENLNPPLTEATLTPQQKTEMEQALGPQPQQEPPRVQRVVTQFIGDKEKVYFTTASGFRLRKENKISELMEVGYYIQTCKSRRQPEIEFDCLWRSVSYNLDGEVTKGQEGTVLLENVKRFEIDYLGYSQAQEEIEWFESWDSTQVNDQRFGEMFPQGVKIKLTVDFVKSKDAEKVKTRTITGFFPIAFANNKPFQRIRFPDPTPPTTGGATTPPQETTPPVEENP